MNESREHGLRGDDRRDESAAAERNQEHDHGQCVRGPDGQVRWPQPDVAEQLLNGEDVTDADPRTAGMAGLLAAARALPPGRPQDEATALDAFRRAAGADTRARSASPAAVPVPVVGGRWRTKRVPRPVRMLVGGVLAVSAIGGVAVAAQGGGLPHPFHSSGGAADRPSVPASSARTTGTAPGLPRAPGTTPGSGTPTTHPGAAPHAPGTVSPAPGAPADTGTGGLCEAYAKAERDGTTPGATVRARLAEAAGSAAGIGAYCAALTDSPAPTSRHGHGQKSAEPHAGPSSTASVVPRTATPPDASVRVAPSASRRK